MRRSLVLLLALAFLGLHIVSLVAPAPRAAAWSTFAGRPGQEQSPLTISKAPYPDPALANSMLFYTVTVYNSGPLTLTDVVISDTLPAGSVLEGAHPCFLPGYGRIAHCVGLSVGPQDETSVWFGVGEYSGPVVVNEEYAVGAPGLPPAYGPTVAVRVVTCTPGPPPPPPYPGPTTTAPPATETVEAPEPTAAPAGAPNLVLSQPASSGPADPGGLLTLHFVVTNEGTAAAYDVVLSALVPAGLQAQDVTVTPAAATEWTGNTLWVAWGALAPGASATVALRAAVLPGAASGLELVAALPDQGLESRAVVDLVPAALPDTGGPAVPWWGWAALIGALLCGGLFLRQSVRHDVPH